jgi:hypothetical protein
MLHQIRSLAPSKFIIASCIGVALTGCATPVETSIVSTTADRVEQCQELGAVAGSNALFVGLSASIGRTRAQNDALAQASTMGATHVVWREMGTSLTNEWVGTAYQCAG